MLLWQSLLILSYTLVGFGTTSLKDLWVRCAFSSSDLRSISVKFVTRSTFMVERYGAGHACLHPVYLARHLLREMS